MQNIKIQCPKCNKSFYKEIKEELLKDNLRGILAINFDNTPEKHCSHSFVAYIDKNLMVRDYLLTDFKLKLPEMKEVDQKKEKIDIPSKELIDVYLLSINLNTFLSTSVLRGCFHKKKILILWEHDFLKEHILNFFNFIFQDSFKIDISLERTETYEKNKKQFRDYLVISNTKVINDKDKIINPKKMKIEQVIIQFFLDEPDPKICLILLKNEIQKAYRLSRELIELNKHLKASEELTSKRILTYFEQNLGVNIHFPYLTFLKEIVKNYFNYKLTITSQTTDFVGF